MARQPKGEGSIWQAKEGRWRGRATVKGVTVTVSGSTLAEARNNLTRRRADVLNGVQGKVEKVVPLTVGTWAGEWLTTCVNRLKANQLKPKTVEGYASMVGSYILPHLGSVPLAKLDVGHIHQWHADLLGQVNKKRRDEDGDLTRLSPGTVAGAHRVLRAMLRAAQQADLVRVNVASVAGGPKGVDPTHDFLTIEEVGMVVAAFDGSRASAAVALGLLGLRRGEIGGLRWSDVNLDRGLVTIRESIVAVGGSSVRGTPKRRSSFRTITVDDALLDALRRWKVTQLEQRLKAGPLWQDTNAVITTRHGKAMDPNTMGRGMIRFVLDACGRAVSPHSLRHTSASLMYDAGADIKSISEHLGHGNQAVTEAVYTHLLTDARRRGGDALGRALKAASDTTR